MNWQQQLCPGHQQEMDGHPCHMRSIHAENAFQAKSITVIIWKGYLVHVKINWYDLHSFKWACCMIITEMSFGKHSLQNVVMAVCFRTQWASHFHDHASHSPLCWDAGVTHLHCFVLFRNINLFYFLKFYLSIVDLQRCDHFSRTTKWFCCTWPHIRSLSDSFPTWIITWYWVEFSVLYRRSTLANHFH